MDIALGLDSSTYITLETQVQIPVLKYMFAIIYSPFPNMTAMSKHVFMGLLAYLQCSMFLFVCLFVCCLFFEQISYVLFAPCFLFVCSFFEQTSYIYYLLLVFCLFVCLFAGLNYRRKDRLSCLKSPCRMDGRAPEMRFNQYCSVPCLAWNQDKTMQGLLLISPSRQSNFPAEIWNYIHSYRN